ncbi:MAG TPA: hypothetical protein VGF53_07190 [Pseudolabrys sp.]|jgi:hypothetical protein
MRKPKAKSKAKRAAAVRKPSAQPLRHDPRLKKIYVYSEGTFVLHNAAEIHKIVIKTKAFDVSGWLDLSQMRPGGDTVETEVRASFANRSNVGYGKWQWSGPKLLALGDMTNRLNYLSGTHIEIWVQQTTSFDNFAKPVEYAYQFVVESQ